MTWALKPTTEMPPVQPRRPGHRRRTSILIALLAIVLAGAGAVGVVALTGALSGPLTTVPAALPPTASTPAYPALLASDPPSGFTPSAAPAPTTLAPASHTADAATADLALLERQVLSLTNEQRASHGCQPLRSDERLRVVARAFSVDMASNGYLLHTGRDGSSPASRMVKAGYDVSHGWAENIARGYPSATAVVAAWMASKDHRANILNCGLQSVGVGVARASSGELYWTQDFGAV